LTGEGSVSIQTGKLKRNGEWVEGGLQFSFGRERDCLLIFGGCPGS